MSIADVLGPAPSARLLAWTAENAMLRDTSGGWEQGALMRLARDLHAVADTGHELSGEQLRAASDLVGILAR